jgi:hypothetical protein
MSLNRRGSKLTLWSALAIAAVLFASRAACSESRDDLAASWSMLDVAIPGGENGPSMIRPPAGVEVAEAVTTLESTGETIWRDRSWMEPFGSDVLITMVQSRPGGQFSINRSLHARNAKGCLMVNQVEYDRAGTPLRQLFWLADPARNIPGAMKFPPDLCPTFALDGYTMLTALDAPQPGATGVVNAQTSPWGYFQLNVKASGPRSLSVPAGTFSSLQLDSWVNLQSMYPSMPSMVARSVEALASTSRVWTDAAPPYKFIRYEGPVEGLGPKVSTELARSSVAVGQQPRAGDTNRDTYLTAGAVRTVALGGPAGLEDRLRQRGLLGGDDRVRERDMQPPQGVEIREYEQRLKSSGELMFKIRGWDEPIEGGSMHVELTSFTTGRWRAFWISPPNLRDGCKMEGLVGYNAAGRAIQGDFWRNDPALRVAGAPDFPTALFPDSAPADFFFRVLDSARVGATGTLNQQIGTFSYVGLDNWITGIERVKVPAGEFDAFKTVMRVNLRTVAPWIPGFLVPVLEPFMPKNSFYFQTAPPYRFVLSEGSPGFQAPETTTRLVRYYIAGANSGAHAAQPSNAQSASR